MVLPYPNIHILNNYVTPLSCSALSTIWNPVVLIRHTCTIISKKIPTIPTPSMKFMLGSVKELVGRFRLFPSVQYCVLPGAVWCSAHTPGNLRVPSGSVTDLHLEKLNCQEKNRFVFSFSNKKVIRRWFQKRENQLIFQIRSGESRFMGES